MTVPGGIGRSAGTPSGQASAARGEAAGHEFAAELSMLFGGGPAPPAQPATRRAAAAATKLRRCDMAPIVPDLPRRTALLGATAGHATEADGG